MITSGPKPTLAYVLRTISEIKDKKQKVEALKTNGIEPLKAVLKGMFDPRIKFNLPEGDPPYTPSEHNDPSALMKSTNMFFHFIEGGTQMTRIQREKLFLQLLEAVDADDAKLILAMKEKKSPFPGLTKDVVIAAFPEMFPT
jgi:Family of unknown function (DUF6433)